MHARQAVCQLSYSPRAPELTAFFCPDKGSNSSYTESQWLHTKKRECSFFIIAKTPEARKRSLGDKKGTEGHGGSEWSFLTSTSEAMSYPHAVLPPRCAALLKLLVQVTIWSTFFLFASWSLSHNIPRSQIHYLQQLLELGVEWGSRREGQDNSEKITNPIWATNLTDTLNVFFSSAS